MGQRTTVYVQAEDPVSQAGIASQVRVSYSLQLADFPAEAEVGVVVAEQLDPATVTAIRGLVRGGLERIVLVASHIDDSSVLIAAEAGVKGIVRRNQATPEALADAVRACAMGEGTMPPDLLGRLLRQVGRLQRDILAPRGLGPHGLNDREVAVLRLVADGHGTGEIAHSLAYSERTVKNVIHDVVTRLNLRNRSHAVAYAVREGII